MTPWILDDEFEIEKAQLLQRVDARRWRVLRILVHKRCMSANVDPRNDMIAYACFLGPPSQESHRFEEIDPEEAEAICATAAQYELIMGNAQMGSSIATELARTWLARFGDHARFFTNGETKRTPRELRGTPWPLFHTDLELGVIAVSPENAGLFWNAENS